MKATVSIRALLLTGVLAAAARAAEGVDYAKDFEAWRSRHLADLTKADGWLTLIGRHWLQAGDNTVGSAADNSVRLAAGPAHFGIVNVAPGSVVTYRPDPSAAATVDGQPAQPTRLYFGGGQPATRVHSGTVTFYILQHGDKLGLRVKDSAAARRVNFAGLEFYPRDPSWRIEAQWVPFTPPHQVNFVDVLGGNSSASIPGKAVFTRGGHTYELIPIDEGAEHPLFFVIGDATNGHGTHGGGRFLYADWPKDGKVVLDFNHLENPPCAFSPFTICPLPPKENMFPVALELGEKHYRDDPE